VNKRIKKTIGCFALVTDFGSDGPYLGQVHAVLTKCSPSVPIINLLSDAPLVNPRATAYLLSALSKQMPDDVLFLSIVDPGVGGERIGLIVETDRHLYVGPDNGLLSQVVRHSSGCQIWKINWNSVQASMSFHGRDIFAPIATKLANNEPFPKELIATASIVGEDWPALLYECIYIDHYGNIFTGISKADITSDSVITIGSKRITFARTFSDVSPGELFWYVNSCGLIEIAANMERASEKLKAQVGDAVTVGAG